MRTREAGFTLVEVLVALFLLALGLLAVAPMFVYATRVAAASADLGTVDARAVHRLEVLRATDFSALVATVNGSSIKYGLFLNALISFLLVAGAIYFFIARPDRGVRAHLHDEAEATGAERG